MKIEKCWMLIFFCALIILGCREKQLPEGQEELILDGTWTEQFTYEELVIYMGAETPPENISNHWPEVSEITFANGCYTIRFPGHNDRSYTYYTDPITKGQTGTYKVVDGFLILMKKDGETEEKFQVTLSHQSMKLSLYSYTYKDGTIAWQIGSSLWGHSLSKTSGEFTKKPLQ